MLKPAILTFVALVALNGGATAANRYGDRYSAPPPSSRFGRSYGPGNNHHGRARGYAAPRGGYSYYPGDVYPDYGVSYAAAPEWDANSYGAGYDWSHGYGYGPGGGYAYPAYGQGYGYGYPPANEAQRLSPWAGYNGGFGNGYR